MPGQSRSRESFATKEPQRTSHGNVPSKRFFERITRCSAMNAAPRSTTTAISAVAAAPIFMLRHQARRHQRRRHLWTPHPHRRAMYQSPRPRGRTIHRCSLLQGRPPRAQQHQTLRLRVRHGIRLRPTFHLQKPRRFPRRPIDRPLTSPKPRNRLRLRPRHPECPVRQARAPRPRAGGPLATIQLMTIPVWIEPAHRHRDRKLFLHMPRLPAPQGRPLRPRRHGAIHSP